jgi:glyoxylase-like metal-dependent hydrolase (beta-lactamase superfamily II)
MKISNNLAMLELKMKDQGAIYPTLLWDDENLVIVDTGLPMQMDLIKEAVLKEGFSVSKINKIILTHQDIDHIGCIKDILKEAKDAIVLAYVDEAPYIDGTKTPVKLANMEKNFDKLSGEAKNWFHQLKAGFEDRKVKIDEKLKDGEVLPICGGIQVIHTPGHTPGHICLLALESKVLISGDSLNIKDGKLVGATPEHSLDMDLAKKSVEKLQNYDIKAVIAYHGGLFQGDVKQAFEDIVNGN